MNSEEHSRLKTLQGMVREKDDELADLRQKLAEAREEVETVKETRDWYDRLLTDEQKRCTHWWTEWKKATEQLAAQAAELEKLRVHNETLVREHKEVAVEVSALHVEIENMRYAADVGLTEEANSADRWVGHARRLFKLKCEYSQKCREKDAELATLRERLAAAERFRFGSLLFSCSNNGWECFRMSDGSYLGDPPHSNTFIYKTFDEAYQAAIAAGWRTPSTKGEA